MAGTLTTERFFASAQYMQHGGEDWTTIRNTIEFDNLNQGIDSLFNHFSMFSYSNNILEKYEPSAHFAGYAKRSAKTNIDAQNSLNQEEKNLKTIPPPTQRAADLTRAKIAAGKNNIQRSKLDSKYSSGYVSSPTAQTIIDWSVNASSKSVLGFQPYSWTDFGFCKYYGKIPNNRLITLRRYPFPVDDRLRNANGQALIPIAQAVTWFGDETGNKLSTIGNFRWNMPWEELVVTQQDIEGNETTVDDLLGLISGLGGTKGKATAEAIRVAIVAHQTSEDPSKIMSINGMDKKLQEYVKNAYNKDSGPYWNQIYGPVNVIHKSQRRARGVQEQYASPFTLKFHYSFRSFSGLSPKMAALDLIMNFLQLTYNNAQFLGQLSRYFPKTGVKFDETTTQTITNLIQGWGTGRISPNEALKAIVQLMTNAAKIVKQDVTGILGDVGEGKWKSILNRGTNLASVFAATKSADLIPKLISAKSALSDRPVGEWHLVVGNPLNPIFVMGDLLITDTKMAFDDEIGPEDFPTGITFTVDLKQGKPRDKFAIERMFNSGNAGLGSTKIATSSEEDTFKKENDERYQAAYSSKSIEDRVKAVEELAAKSSSFARTRERVGLAYGYMQPSVKGSTTSVVTNPNIDDTLLAIYFKKDMGST